VAPSSRIDGQTSRAVYEKAIWVFKNAQVSNYEHNHLPVSKQVHVRNGNACVVKTNCSGFVGYVLYTTARTQFDAIRSTQPERSFPQAMAYAKFFETLSPSIPHKGWLKVGSIAELRRGDLIAWQTPGSKTKGRGNTGHTMFVIETPGPAQVLDGMRFVSVLVLDCSSVTHFQPEQLPKGAKQSIRDGIGKGVIRLLVNENDEPIGYWEGTYSSEKGKRITRPTVTDSVAFARPVSDGG